MEKQIQKALIGSGLIIDLVGVLKDNQIGNLPNPDYKYTSFTSQDFQVGKVKFVFNPNIQRMYLFNDVPLGKGHPWQRSLFKSYLMGEPVGTVELWYNPKENHYEVLDAQQRLRTLKAIFDDCVKTPKGLVIDGIDCGDMHYSGLPDQIRIKFIEYRFLVVASYISLENAVERFIGINNGNPLSAQDKRSPQVSDFADFIRQIAFYPNPAYEFSKFQDVDGKLQLKYFSFPHYGRTMDEMMSYLYLVIYKNGIQTFSQTELNKLYTIMKDSPTEFNKKNQKDFQLILSILDKLVSTKSWKVKETKKKDLLHLMLLLNHYTALGGSISQPDVFIEKFYSAIYKCRKNKKLMYTDKNGEISDFATVWRLGTDKDYIEFVIGCLISEINNTGIIYKDDKRTFSRSEIESKLDEQNCKCVYCNESIELNQAIGDHMIPHSRGGRTIYENLAVSCKDCNSMKSSLPWDGWVHAVKKMNGVDLSNLQLNTNELMVNQNV